MATVDLGRIKFVWQGTWSSSTAYVVDDVVYNDGSAYVCILASTNNEPPNATYWNVMAQGSDLGSISGLAQGDVVYYNGTSWTNLAAGTSGNFLQTQGSGANPQWASASAGLKSQQVFTTTGSSTWTKPSGINLVKVIVTGGGGGGGGGNPSWNHGSGGGAGGTAIKIIDVSSVSTVSVTVGSGGSGGGGNSNGSAGGTSSFGSYCSATGGKGGTKGSTVCGQNTGVGSSGDINIYGGNGTSAGGGAASQDETGGYVGGASYWGGGMEGATANSTFDAPGAALAYGSGGGPGDDNNGSGGVGKAGAPGIVVVEEYA